MSAEPKRVELTEAEIDALVNTIGDVCSHTGPVVPSLPWGCPDCDEIVRAFLAGTVERIVAAREAAVKSMDATMGMWQEQYARAEKAEAKVARVEALAHRARLGTVSASDITAALAEPERDEEGGR